MATESDISRFAKGVASSDAKPLANPVVQRKKIVAPPLTPQEANADIKPRPEKLPQFTERKYRCEELEYPRNGTEPGLLLIFNQENFLYHKQRLGSRRDVNEIIICFQRLGYNIEVEDILTDGTTEEVLNKLRDVSKRDFTKYNSLVVFFLTHGDICDLLYTKDSHIWAYDIWKIFCGKLKDKPKIFILQACKGEDHTTTGESETKTSKIIPQKIFSTNNNLSPDFLIAYSTIEGNVSFRNKKIGSWFIQELCKNFLAYGRRDDIFSLLIRTSKCVSGNYYLSDTIENKKQMPLVVSTLTKKFYLNTNKERHVRVEVVEKYNEIYRQLYYIHRQLQDLNKKD